MAGKHASLMVRKHGECGMYELGPGSRAKVEFEMLNLREYGMIPTRLTIQENEDVSVNTTCGDMQYVYSTGSGAVSIQVEGNITATPTKDTGDSDEAGTKDHNDFYQEYRISLKKYPTKLTYNKQVYYVILIGWEVVETSAQGEVGTFRLTFVGVRS